MDGKFTMRCPGCGAAFVVRPQRPAGSDPVLVTADWPLAEKARK
jgi:hypothetical protein